MQSKILHCLLPIGLIALVMALITPNSSTAGLYTRPYTVFATAIFCIQVCVVWFFLTGLRNYQQKLQRAYSFLSGGIFLLGIAQIQLPIIIGFDLLDSWWISTGLILVPFALSTFAVYLSGWLMARALGVSSSRVAPLFVAAAVIIVCLASSALPHVRVTGTPAAELEFDAFTALTIWMLSFNSMAAILFWRIKSVVGILYASAMRWLGTAITLAVLGSTSELLYSLLTPESLTWYTQHALNLVPLLITSVTLLGAGAAFKTISERRISPNANPVDVIVYTAQLVSEPQNIDSSLNSLRDITVRVNDPNQLALTPTDEKAIVDLYRTIETYLAEEEPMRKFSREELRALLPDSFHLLLKRYS